MNLSVILRTHDTSNLHGERYTGTDKAEVVYRCLYSLVTTINCVIEQRLCEVSDISLLIIDDHSKGLDVMRDICSRLLCSYRIESLEGTGNNYSMERYFMLGARAPELVYFVEDDYLHTSQALSDMIVARDFFEQKLGRSAAVLPQDDPDNYQAHTLRPSYIVAGPNRHWRTTEWSLCTFLLHSDIVRTHWEIFYTMARFYEVKNGVHEGSTFGQIWSQHVPLFAPVPTLALHVQTEKEKDPYVDWREWWGKNDYRNNLA